MLLHSDQHSSEAMGPKRKAASSSNTKLCFQRLQKELRAISNNPLPNMTCAVNPDNMLEWQYVLLGAPDSVYRGGVYHGLLRFSKEYPFKPPSIIMTTPNGRFETCTRLCLSISDYHPETWNPLWSVSTILLGISSFFYEDEMTAGACRGVTDDEKRRLAAASLQYNLDEKKGPKGFAANFQDFIDNHVFREMVNVDGAACGGGDDGHGEVSDDTPPAPQRQAVVVPPPKDTYNYRTLSMGLLCASVIVIVVAMNIASR